jgi:c-di-GMP phosphodiesterase
MYHDKMMIIQVGESMNLFLKTQFLRYVKYGSIILILIFSLDLLASLIGLGAFSSTSSIDPIYVFSVLFLAVIISYGAVMMISRELYGSSVATLTGLFYIALTQVNETISQLGFKAEYVVAIGVISMICFMYDKQIRKKAIEISILKHKLNHLEQDYRITKSMMEITPEMLLDDDLDKLLDRILMKAIELIPRAQSGSILIKEDDLMIFRAAKGYDLNVLKKIHLRFEDMFQFKIGNLYEPAVIQDIKTFNEKNINSELSKSSVLEVSVAKAVLTCAIMYNEEIYGFINLDNLDDQNAFNQQDKLMIKHLAQQIEVALKNHTLVEEIYKLSQYDTLTGANSRKHHEKLIEHILEQAKVDQIKFCIAVIDVNDLKKVNDTLGHSVGDGYLVHFSNIIKKHINEKTIFSRTGGDEFVMVFSECEPNCANDKIEDIRKELKAMPFLASEHLIDSDFGCGIACYPTDGTDWKALMRLSDKRMYEDKRSRKLIK